MPRRIALLCIMPAPDVFQDEIECSQGQSPIGRANCDTRRRQKERRLPIRSITAPFSFQIIGQCIPGVGGEKDGAFGFALAFHVGNFGLARRSERFRRVGFYLVQVQTNDFFPPETRGEQEIDDGPITGWPRVRLHLVACLPTPLKQVEVLKPITEILQGTYLVLTQGSRLQGRESQFSDALGGVARSKELRGMRIHPGTEAGERGQVVIDRRMRQIIRLHLLLPGDNIAFQTRRNAIMPIGSSKLLKKASQMQGNFLCDGWGTNADHG